MNELKEELAGGGVGRAGGSKKECVPLVIFRQVGGTILILCFFG